MPSSACTACVLAQISRAASNEARPDSERDATICSRYSASAATPVVERAKRWVRGHRILAGRSSRVMSHRPDAAEADEAQGLRLIIEPVQNPQLVDDGAVPP